MPQGPDRRAVAAGLALAGAAGVGLWFARSPRGAAGAKAGGVRSGLADFRRRPLEAGEVILDPRRYPKTLREAPQLAAQVREGRLPPVRERIGEDPLVVQPLHGIGRYGGVLRRASLGPGEGQTIGRFAGGPDSLLYWSHDWRTLRPNIARGFEVSRDGRVTTLLLRRGMRWSDGAPFTADDILFWYEDMYHDPRVIASRSAALRFGDREVTIRKLDAHTVEYVSPEPYFLLGEMLAGATEIGGPSVNRGGLGGFAPRHYLSRFHPKYASEEALNREARAAGFANWSIRLKDRFEQTLNPDLPVVSPWRVTSPINTPEFALDRNPYSIWVDTAGNQLPYIDRIAHSYCSNADAVNFKAAAGEFDFQERNLQIRKLAFLVSNQDRANYDVHLDPHAGADLTIRVNLCHTQDREIGALLADRRFRRALSLGADRHQINETFLYATGLPSAAVPAPDNKYYPGDAWAQRWAAHDPAQANRLLDEIGLTARDAKGYRLRRDGGGRLRLICSVYDGELDYAGVSEMLRAQWRAIGIDIDTKLEARTLWLQKAMSGGMQITPQYTITEDPFTFPDFLFPFSRNISSAVTGVEYAEWFQTGGRKGREPPPEIRRLMQLWSEGRGAPAEQRLEIGREIIRGHVDEVLSIGLTSSGLATFGIHIANRDLGNVPRRVINSSCLRSPATALPMTFYYRHRQEEA